MLTQLIIICPLLFLAGFVDAIAGGGGIISLPAFLIAGLPAHAALGTNKLASTIGTTASTFRYLKNGYLKGYGKLAAGAVVCALVGSSIGSNIALMIPGEFITKTMLVVLPVVAFFVLKNKHLGEDSEKEPVTGTKLYFIAYLAALVVGCYDGLYGPGTGTFLLLILTSVARMHVREASACTKVINLTSNVSALAVFILNGTPVYSLGIPAALFCMAGHFAGSGLVVSNGTKIVRPIILFVLAALFVKVLTGF